MSLEDAGFCEKDTGMEWIKQRGLTFRGDFPVNTAGGMHHVCDGVRQLTGRAGAAQIADYNTAFVTGNGGIMSKQVALIMQGESAGV